MTKFSNICICMCSFFLMALKPIKKTTIKWQTTEDVTNKWNNTKKPIIIDIYTTWCHYCKVMDKKTYANDSIATYINKNFYAIKLNAESKTPISWMGKTYNYSNLYKINEITLELTKGHIVYPTTVIIPVTGEPQYIGGALSVTELEAILKYYGENFNKTIDWTSFLKSYKAKFKK
jgi:thioredoxin-related protein